MSDWVSTDERMPTKDDADEYGCVLAWHMFQGVIVTGWFNVGTATIGHWMKTPDGPADAEARAKAYKQRLIARYGDWERKQEHGGRG